MPDARDRLVSDCVCGHPAAHHEAGECWTGPTGAEIHLGDPFCPCDWYEPVGEQ